MPSPSTGNPLRELRFRFSDVAYGIEGTPKSLRKWLQSGKVKLDSDSDLGWRAFSYFDLAKLAFMRRLVDFGVGIEAAAAAAAKVTPYGASGRYGLEDSFKKQRLYVFREAGEWRFAPRLVGGLRAAPEADALLTLDLHAIVVRAFDRATLHNTLVDDQPEAAARGRRRQK